jgi:hypothetical protein
MFSFDKITPGMRIAFSSSTLEQIAYTAVET